MNAAAVVTSCLALGSRGPTSDFVLHFFEFLSVFLARFFFCMIYAAGYKIEEKDIREGLSSVRSEGRFQVLTKDEADSLGCKELTVVLDGGKPLKYR